jgi:hypothetical protein
MTTIFQGKLVTFRVTPGWVERIFPEYATRIAVILQEGLDLWKSQHLRIAYDCSFFIYRLLKYYIKGLKIVHYRPRTTTKLTCKFPLLVL